MSECGLLTDGMDDRTNIVWISLESVRADRTTLGGYDRNTTPNLQRITESGGNWHPRCFSQAHWTPAVSASILTGTYPSTHGVGLADTTNVNTVPDGLRTVPELLSDRGYTTACFSSNPYVSPATELDRGFDRFHEVPEQADLLSGTGVATAARYFRNIQRYGAGLTTDLARHKDPIYPLYQTAVLRKWLGNLSRGSKPFFLYTHVNSPHHPYDPPLSILERFLDDDDPEPAAALNIARAVTDNIWREVADGCSFTPRQTAALRAVYDAEVAYADLLVGQVFDRVRRVAPENTVFVVTGDHGELFGERGMLGHNLVLHDGLIRVPMVTWGFDDSWDTDGVVQHLDVMQTALAAVGAPTDQFEGYDLRSDHREYALVQRGPRHSDIARIAEHDPDFDLDRYHSGTVECLRSRRWKYVQGEDRTELFDLPDEGTDVSGDHPDVVARFEAALDASRPDATTARQAGEAADFSPTMEQRLKDLGYL